MKFLQRLSFVVAVAVVQWTVLEGAPSEGHWIAEKSSATLKIAESSVENKDEDEWMRHNALWSAGATEDAYWEIRLSNFSSGAVGVTTKDAFQPGWDLVGLMYAGGLSNGTDIVEPDFGPAPKNGDAVGVFLQFSNNKASVSFYLNGHLLGEGFLIPTTNASQLHPVVSFEGPGVATMQTITTTPPPPTETVSTTDQPSTVVTGFWLLDVTSLHCDDDNVPAAPQIEAGDVNVTLRLSPTTEADARIEYAATLTVINIMQFPLAYNASEQQWSTPGMRISTNHSGAGATLAFERWINAFSFDPEAVVVVPSSDGKENLVISNDDCVVTFNRIHTKPIETSPFIN